ncbi:putative ribonuclease H-like domain-containing protein [Tanacetum coccineum]
MVLEDENTRKSVIEQHTYRQAENLMKSQSPRVDKRNWNGILTQKLGNGFEFNKKACFVCGSHNHLIKDLVVTKSGQVPVNIAKKSSSRAAASISTTRPVNTDAPKSKGNPQYALQDQGIFDSGCSRHMTGNKSYLIDYQDVDGGFVAFAGSPKGGSGPDWLFDIDLLTNSMNYEPVTAGNQTNKNAGIKDDTQQYIMLPLLYDSPQSLEDAVADDAGKKTNEEPANKAELDNLLVQQKKGYANSTNRDSTVSPSVSTAGQNFTNTDDLPTDPLMLDLNDTGIFSGTYDDEDVEPKKVIQALTDPSWIEAMQEELLQFKLQKVWTLVDLPKGKRAIETKWVYRNKKDKRGTVVRNKARLVSQCYTQEEGIDNDEVFASIARIELIRLFFAFASFMGLIVYQMDMKSAFLYGTIEEEVYVKNAN